MRWAPQGRASIAFHRQVTKRKKDETINKAVDGAEKMRVGNLGHPKLCGQVLLNLSPGDVCEGDSRNPLICLLPIRQKSMETRGN